MVFFSRFRFSLLVFQPGTVAVLHGVRPKCVFLASSGKYTTEEENGLKAHFCAKENMAFMRIYA
jgi:hypothetical protein